MSVYINGVVQPAPGVAVMIAAHAALTTGIHGVGSLHIAGFHSAGEEVSRVIWKDEPATVIIDLSRTEDLAYTDEDVTVETSANAKLVYLIVGVKPDTVGSGNYCRVRLRKNGITPSNPIELRINKNEGIVGSYKYRYVLLALDSGQVFEYDIDIGTGWQLDTYIRVAAYVE